MKLQIEAFNTYNYIFSWAHENTIFFLFNSHVFFTVGPRVIMNDNLKTQYRYCLYILWLSGLVHFQLERSYYTHSSFQ